MELKSERIIEEIRKNKHIDRLLNHFKEEYEDAYINLNSSEKEVVMDENNEIFKKWLCSPILVASNLTPNFIINEFAQSKIKGNYFISPYITIKKDEKLKFNTEYVYYSMEDHPVFKDIESIVKYTNPTITVGVDKELLVEEYDKLMEEVQFKSEYYILYLIDLCIALNILKGVISIGCGCYKVNKEGYDEFKNLSNNEKLKKIFDATVDNCVKNLRKVDFIGDLIDKNIVIKFLNNNMKEEDYLDIMNNLNPEIYNAINTIYKKKNSKDILDKNMGELVIKAQIRIHMDILFTTVFGQYLGIISPTYLFTLLISQTFFELTSSKEFMQKMSILWKCDDMHDLTPLGEEIMDKSNVHIDKREFKYLDTEHIEEIINYGIEEKNSLIKVRKENEQIFIDPDLNFDKILNFVENFNCDDNSEEEYCISEFVHDNMDDFFFYLGRNNLDNCLGYVNSAERFAGNYLKCKDEKELKKINEEIVDKYFNDLFIKKIAENKNSIIYEVGAISEYLRFLNKKRIIRATVMKSIIKNIDNGKKYFTMFDKYQRESKNI